VPLAEDQHSVGDLGSDGQDEAFGEAVRPWTPGRDLDHFDARVCQDRVERGRELPGPVAELPRDSATALFCVERDPEACHRSLVAECLRAAHGLLGTDLHPG
jgi:Protein of unknown function, DUF488